MSSSRRQFPHTVIIIMVAFLFSAFFTFSTHLTMNANHRISNGDTIEVKSDEVVKAEEVKAEESKPAENKVEVVKPEESGNTSNIASNDGEGKEINKQAPEEQTKHKFAYAFLIAGCDPRDPNYKGYIYNVAVAKALFNRFNSTHDVIVHIRMHADTNETKLPDEDQNILEKSGLIIKYIPKPPIDNFHTAMMDKFRILQLTEYTRVLYLDADVIPLNNLDYVFDLSVPSKEQPNPPLEENLILAYNREPSSGGFFMMAPQVGDYEKMIDMVDKRNKEGYHFNETTGWGHEMIPPDGWESLAGFQGSKWDFYGAFTDQGMIYHWTKYVKKKVTQANGRRLRTFGEDKNGNIVVIRDVSQEEVFHAYPKNFHVHPGHHSKPKFGLKTSPPYRDFHHFKEYFKPWVSQKSERKDHGPHELWYQVLRNINEKYKFGLDVDEVEKIGFPRPKLGMYPTFNMVEEVRKHHEKNGETLK